MSKHPTLVKRGNAEDELTGDAFEIFAFRKVGNRLGELKLDRDKARDFKYVLDQLIRKNADLPFVDKGARSIVKAAIASRPTERVLYCARCGWRPDQRAFVTSRTVIGSAGKRRLVQPVWVTEHQSLPMRSQGTLQDWQATVATYALHSAPAMLAIAAALAAPLLVVTERQPFGINLFGPPKAGKTTAALAGASVIGIGREPDLPNWGASHAARGEQARLFNDMLLPINEVGLLGGSKKSAYAEIRTMIYALGEGRERRRHSASSYTSPAETEEFRTIFFSTAERSFDKYAELAIEPRDHGEYARCLDVPAAAKHKTIMNFIPTTVAEPDRAQWATHQVKELRRACQRQHGTAFGPYIEHLIEQGRMLKSLVEGYADEFLKKVRSRQMEGVLEHAAENFALIYAGGCLGIDSGVLPWSKTKLLKAISRCFRQALDELGRAEDVVTRAHRKLRDGIKAADIVKWTKTDLFSEDQHHGFYRTKDGVRTYFVHAKQFRAWFGGHEEMQAALSWLNSKGYLRPKKARSASKRGKGTDWAEQTRSGPTASQFGRLCSLTRSSQRSQDKAGDTSRGLTGPE